MPLYDLGYRSWSGHRTTFAALSQVVASTGFRLAWKSRWLRRLLLAGWLPAAYMGLGIFFFEKSLEYPEMREAADDFLRHGMPGRNIVTSFFGGNVDFFSGDLEKARYKVWAYLLLTMFRYTQGAVMVVVVGLIAPPLIANDLRTRAYLIYFSRPLSVAQYLFGKSTVVWSYLLLIVTLPALALFVIGVGLSSDLNVLRYTWDLPLRILLASAVLVVPTTALALGLSSLFTENRYASASWFAIWILGAVVYANLTVVQSAEGSKAGSTVVDVAVAVSHAGPGAVMDLWPQDGQRSSDSASDHVGRDYDLVSSILLVRRVTAPARA